MSFDWKILKSGTDLRGTALRIPADSDKPLTLTPDRARQVAAAFVDLLSEIQPCSGKPRIAVGYDSRLSGPALAQATREGLAARGAAVLDVSLCTTPAMFMTTGHPATQCDGAIMITASHLPADRNGLKFFTREGGLSSSHIDRLLSLVKDLEPITGPDAATSVAFLPLYCQSLTHLVRNALSQAKPFAGLHILVDAGNGAGGFYAQWLKDLGADTSGSQFLEPDGRFPGHAPNPEDANAMASLSEAVLRHQADLGILFDADCDRAALVDAQGQAINRDKLIALCADMVLAQEPGATLVTDSVTSTGLAQYIQAKGGVHHRFKRGYRNVIDEAKRLNEAGINCPLAIETSGHAALRENFFLDDGMYLVTRLLIEAVRCQAQGISLTDSIASLAEPLEERELRLNITTPDFRTTGQAALDALQSWLAQSDYIPEKENHEGLRANTPQRDGWFLLRMSLHDPLLVWNAQSNREGGVEDLQRDLYKALEGVVGIALP